MPDDETMALRCEPVHARCGEIGSGFSSVIKVFTIANAICAAGYVPSRLGCGARPGNDRDDPAPRVAGLNFHYRMNKPRDERSLYGQGCLFAAMLVIAAAYRNLWISRFEGWHI
jgi:hypothetical protein